MSTIIYWNGKMHMSPLDSLSPWQSLLMINKGNSLFSLICFKCQSSPRVLRTFSPCVWVLFPVKRGGILRQGIKNSAVLCLSCAALAVAGELPEFLWFIYTMRIPMPTLKDCQKYGMKLCTWKFSVKTVLKEAPNFQWSKFPVFENVVLKQKKQYNNSDSTTRDRKELH